MESNKASVVAFHMICLVVTFAMMLYAAVKFYLDESTSIVDAKSFLDTSDDIYPVFTLCLEMDDKKRKLTDPAHPMALYAYKNETDKKFNMDLNEIHEYVNFMMGRNKSTKALTYDYDDITIDIHDYLIMVKAESGKNVLYKWERKDTENEGFGKTA